MGFSTRHELMCMGFLNITRITLAASPCSTLFISTFARAQKVYHARQLQRSNRNASWGLLGLILIFVLFATQAPDWQCGIH